MVVCVGGSVSTSRGVRGVSGLRRRERPTSDLLPSGTGRLGSAQAIFKAALNELCLPGGYPRRPLLPLEPEGVRS